MHWKNAYSCIWGNIDLGKLLGRFSGSKILNFCVLGHVFSIKIHINKKIMTGQKNIGQMGALAVQEGSRRDLNQRLLELATGFEPTVPRAQATEG